MSLAENVAEVRQRINAAAHRAGRDPKQITLMAVSKTFPPERIREAYDAGLRIFGENRVQEFTGKAAGLRDLHDAEWHMIGHLQSNKAGAGSRSIRSDRFPRFSETGRKTECIGRKARQETTCTDRN